MKMLISVEIGLVDLIKSVVQIRTNVSRVQHVAMESIIVVIIVMRIQVNVQLVTMPVISDVTMGNVFQEVLDVIIVMIVKMDQMKTRRLASIENVVKMNSDVIMVDAFLNDGDAIMIMIVVMAILRMKRVIVLHVHVRMVDSNVDQDIALAIVVVVMVIRNALISRMKQVVHHVIQTVNIVQPIALLAIIRCVFILVGFVMETTIVETIVMKP